MKFIGVSRKNKNPAHNEYLQNQNVTKCRIIDTSHYQNMCTIRMWFFLTLASSYKNKFL